MTKLEKHDKNCSIKKIGKKWYILFPLWIAVIPLHMISYRFNWHYLNPNLTGYIGVFSILVFGGWATLDGWRILLSHDCKYCNSKPG